MEKSCKYTFFHSNSRLYADSLKKRHTRTALWNSILRCGKDAGAVTSPSPGAKNGFHDEGDVGDVHLPIVVHVGVLLVKDDGIASQHMLHQQGTI